MTRRIIYTVAVLALFSLVGSLLTSSRRCGTLS